MISWNILTLPVFLLIKITDTTKLFPSPCVYICTWVAGPVPATWKQEYLFPDFVFKDEAPPSLSICDFTDKSPRSYQSTASSLLMAIIYMTTFNIANWVFPVSKRKNIPFWLSGRYTSQRNSLLPLLTKWNKISLAFIIFIFKNILYKF